MSVTSEERFARLRLKAAQSNLADSKNRSLIFQYYKQAGYLPAKDAQGHAFKSFEDLIHHVQRKVTLLKKKYPDKSYGELLRQVQAELAGNRSLRSTKTASDLLITKEAIDTSKGSRTVKGTGYTGPPLTIDTKTGLVRLDKRKYMSADGGLPPPVYDELVSKYGKKEADTYQKAVQQEWKAMNLEARKLGEQTGVEFHRGHWLANKYGGAESARAGSLEIGKLNVLHGAANRGKIKAVGESGLASTGWLDDYYQWRLSNEDLGVSGVRHLKQSDLQAVSNGADLNKLIAKRELEFLDRGGIPDTDSIGMMFGSQLGKDETIAQQATKIKEQNLLEARSTGINPQTGNPISKPEEIDLSRQVNYERKLIDSSFKQAVGLKPAKPITPKLRGAAGGFVGGAAISYLMGESPSQAAAGNIPVVSDITSETAAAERVGSLFVDPVTNRILPQNKAQINTGLAYKKGKPVAVPYGSLKGQKSTGTMIQEGVKQIVDVNKKRLKDLWNYATGLR